MHKFFNNILCNLVKLLLFIKKEMILKQTKKGGGREKREMWVREAERIDKTLFCLYNFANYHYNFVNYCCYVYSHKVLVSMCIRK